MTEPVDLSVLPVNKQLIHALPIPGVQSRLCTAIIFSYQNLNKDVIVIALQLSKRTRAYIITQEGLPGFLFDHHESIESWLYEIKMSEKARQKMPCSINKRILESDLEKVLACKTDGE